MDNHAVILIATFIAQLKLNGVAAFVIQKMKESEHPALAWISTNTPWVSRFVAFLAAAATAVGVHWQYTGSTLVITGLSLTAIFTAAWSIAQNYLVQHAWYKAVFAQSSGGSPVPAAIGFGTGQPATAPAAAKSWQRKRAFGLAAIALLFLPLLSGCAAKTAATVNRDITEVIAGAGGAANQAEQEYQSGKIAQTTTARKAINDLGEAYNQARTAYLTVLTAESVYQGALQTQLSACAPASSGNTAPSTVCSTATTNANSAAAQLQADQAALNAKVSNLANQTQSVQAITK
jgi:hypothetical protein